MDRVPEPELMSEAAQAEAYARADFEEPHSRAIELIDESFPLTEIKGQILDLGCGPGDVTFRCAQRFPEATITAVDGSAAMIELANKRKRREGRSGRKITFLEAFIPSGAIPRMTYDLIMSTSFLHHLHDPTALWKTILRHASPGTRIFVYDLFRPGDEEEAMRMVNHYSGKEPEVLKRDFYNSLRAAFEPEEVERQLLESGLSGLSVRVVSDRHMIITGVKA